MDEHPELGFLLEDRLGSANDAHLSAIAIRAARRRTRRLRSMTACAGVLALLGVGFGLVAEGTRPAPSAARSMSSAALAPRSGSASWTSEAQPLGKAPKGLRWSRLSAPSAGVAAGGAAAAAGAGAVSGSGAPAALCTVGGCGGSVPPGIGHLTRLFEHSAGDVAVRVFSERPIGPRPEPMIPVPSGTSGTSSSSASACALSSQLVLEVSDPGAVGTVELSAYGRAASGGPFAFLESSVVGAAESSPVEVIAVEVGSGVASVEASFADGASDQMAVEQGWAVLVDDGSGPLPATLTALDSSGGVQATTEVSSDAAVAEPARCARSLPPQPPTATPGAANGG